MKQFLVISPCCAFYVSVLQQAFMPLHYLCKSPVGLASSETPRTSALAFFWRSFMKIYGHVTTFLKFSLVQVA